MCWFDSCVFATPDKFDNKGIKYDLKLDKSVDCNFLATWRLIIDLSSYCQRFAENSTSSELQVTFMINKNIWYATSFDNCNDSIMFNIFYGLWDNYCIINLIQICSSEDVEMFDEMWAINWQFNYCSYWLFTAKFHCHWYVCASYYMQHCIFILFVVNLLLRYCVDLTFNHSDSILLCDAR